MRPPIIGLISCGSAKLDGDPAEAAAIIQLIQSGPKAADQTEGK